MGRRIESVMGEHDTGCADGILERHGPGDRSVCERLKAAPMRRGQHMQAVKPWERALCSSRIRIAAQTNRSHAG